MAFRALQTSCKVVFRPIKKFDELEHGVYLVDSFSMKDTKFGKRIFVNIDDFCVVLPPRFLERINKQKQVDELNAGRYNMIYQGKDPTKKNLLLLSFVVAADFADDGVDDDDAGDDHDQPSTSARSRRAINESVDESPKKSHRKPVPKKFY